METIKVIKDGWEHPKGEVVMLSPDKAKEAVDEGWAVYDHFDYLDDYDDSNDEPDEEEAPTPKKKKLPPTDEGEENDTALDILRESLGDIKNKEINWIDSEGDWEKDIKLKLNLALGNGLAYNKEDIDLFFIAHSNDKIKGKVQLIEQHKQRLPLVKRFLKKRDVTEWDKEKNKYIKTGDKELAQKYLFLGESLDARSAGECKDTYSEDMNLYQLVSGDNKKYIVFSKEDLPNCSCELNGMHMELEDNADITKNLKLPSITRGFIMKSFDPAVKILTKKQIVDFTKTREISTQKWIDFLGYHELGSINRFSPEFTKLISSWVLSGKKDNSPLHVELFGIPGTKKSGLLEGIGYKFSNNNIILEGGNSTIKMLKPAFKEKPATLGHYASSERVALVDEVGKMAENELNKHQSSIQNIFGDCNFLFDHKKRIVGSGNNNDCEVEATFKGLEVTNPISNMSTVSRHVGTLDATNLSRKIIWVQDAEETRFLLSDKAIVRLPPKHTHIYTQKKIEHNVVKNKKNIEVVDCVGGNSTKTKGVMTLNDCVGGIFESRDEFLTLFDTCNDFTCELDNTKIQQIFNSILQLAKEPMKTSVWQPRGDRHVFLLIDGLVKERCLFKDYDTTFTPKQEDYDLAERIFVRMVKGWDTDMGLKKEYYTGGIL